MKLTWEEALTEEYHLTLSMAGFLFTRMIEQLERDWNEVVEFYPYANPMWIVQQEVYERDISATKELLDDKFQRQMIAFPNHNIAIEYAEKTWSEMSPTDCMKTKIHVGLGLVGLDKQFYKNKDGIEYSDFDIIATFSQHRENIINKRRESERSDYSTVQDDYGKLYEDEISFEME